MRRPFKVRGGWTHVAVLLGAHTYHGTIFAGDYTDREVERTLVNRANRLQVAILESVYATRPLVCDNVGGGAHGIDLDDGSRDIIHADSVILAAGRTHEDVASHLGASRREQG